MIEFGNRIKELRNQKSLTLEQLAQRLGVSKSLICAYEAGTRLPSLEMLVKLANSFSVSTDYLLGVDKKQLIDVTHLSTEQVFLLKNLILQLRPQN